MGHILFVIAIVFTVWLVVRLRHWWKRKSEEYEDYASKNEIKYLEELADEHERGVKDRAEQLQFLLPRFGERNLKACEQYKSRLDNIRRTISNPFVSNAVLLAKLSKEIQPEIDRMQADHELVMRLIAEMPEPSEDQKRAIAKAHDPAGWQRAIREVLAEHSKRPDSELKST